MEQLRDAVQLLPERERTILFLHYYADLDYATIGRVLGISTGTVGAALNSARNTLRKTFPEVMTA